MNDEYEERGVFKELVLIAWLVLAWFLSWWEGEE
jgi:hypothetical protein